MKRGNFLSRAGAVFVLTVAVALAGEPAADYVAKLETARSERAKRLTKPDGWLTLIGLHFLQPGANSIGTAANNSIVLAKGPAHLGTATLAADGRVSLTVNPAAADDVRIDGLQVLSGPLLEGGEGQPSTLVTWRTVSFFVIERGGKKALRVKDSAAERRTHFLGIDYFPIDPTWRVEARWVPFEKPREVMIKNILGQESAALIPGEAVFERDGKTYALLPLVEGADEPLFFVIADATSGTETYGAARFLYAEPPRDGKLVLDFNEAVNPPCAFTPFATCPLPPKENRLPIAVRAGEKKYRGAED